MRLHEKVEKFPKFTFRQRWSSQSLCAYPFTKSTRPWLNLPGLKWLLVNLTILNVDSFTFVSTVFWWLTLRGSHAFYRRARLVYIEEVLPGIPGGSDSSESACKAGDLGSIPRSGRSPGEGTGYPLQSSCLENSIDRGTWWATVQRIAKSWTQLND